MILATICYIMRDNHTLMLHRIKKENDFHEGKYVPLGGKFEAGESPEECVKREIYEESGLRLTNPQLKGIITLTDEGKNAGSFNNNWYLFVFISKEFTGEIKECNEGDLKWIANEELLSLAMWQGDKDILKWIFTHGFFSAKQQYNGHILLESNARFY